MKIKNININLTLVLLLFITVALSACGDSAGDKSKTGAKTVGSNYASKTPAAGQPIDHSETMVEYETRLKENPKDWRALSGMADSYFGLSKFDKAIEFYKRAVDVNPDDVDSMNDLALSYHYMGDSKEGLKYIETAVKSKPFYQRVWLTKGFILAYGVGDMLEARKAWDMAVSLDAKSQIGKAAADFLTQFKDK